MKWIAAATGAVVAAVGLVGPAATVAAERPTVAFALAAQQTGWQQTGWQRTGWQRTGYRSVCADRPAAEPAAAPTGPTWSATRLGLDHIAGLSQGADQLVAVLDTGVTAIPALAGAVRPAVDLVPPPAAPAPPAGAAPAEPNPAGTDCDGRGTALAGLIAASRGPGTALPGLARAAEILPVRVSAAAGELPDPAVLSQGMTDALAAGATVVLVGGAVRDDPALQAATQAVLNAGVPVIAAAGDGDDPALAFPASYDGVIAVSATGQQDDVRPVNAAGRVTVAAPGVDLVGFGADGGFVAGLGGSAYAAALVAAGVADLRGRFPDRTPTQLRQRLIDTADRPSVAVPDPTLGWGVMNLVGALTAPVDGTGQVGGPVGPTGAAAPEPAIVVELPPVPDDNSWAITVAVLLITLAGGIAAVVAGVRRAQRRRWRPGAARPGVPPPDVDSPGAPRTSMAWAAQEAASTTPAAVERAAGEPAAGEPAAVGQPASIRSIRAGNGEFTPDRSDH